MRIFLDDLPKIVSKAFHEFPMVSKIAVFNRRANPLKRVSKGCKYAKKTQSTLRSEPIIKTIIAKKILENKMSSPEIERLITEVAYEVAHLER